MPQPSGPGKAVYIEGGIWWNPDDGQIHLTVKGVHGFHTTINDNPGSKRCHTNLFGKLAEVLKDNGAPHPPIKEKASA